MPNTLVTDRNFGILSFSGPAKDRQMKIGIHAVDGKLIWEKTIAASELR
jgi:alkaline phosphatase D